MRQQNIKIPPVFHVGVILLCAMLITSYMMGGLYARYTTSASGGDSAHVARFAFSDNFSDQYTDFTTAASAMYPGSEMSLNLVLKNNSEVALRYVITLRNMTENLPLYVGDVKLAAAKNPTVLQSGTIAPGSEGTFTLTISWPATENGLSLIDRMDVLRMTVQVEQVDQAEQAEQADS